ncbi:MAG: two-component protein, sensory box histidine kinase/response regulatory protein, partial [uncultured bacterium]
MQEILAAAKHSTQITRQLLGLARRQTIAPRAISLNLAIESMLTMLQRLLGENLELAWIPGNDIWLINIDPAQLDRILANLCVNARDAITDIGKVTIETRNFEFDEAYCNDHAGYIPGKYVMLAVSDNGHGMNDETINQIYEPFFTTKEAGRGTGLGLAIIYGIVQQNAGFINVYSEAKKGTTFRLYLPRFAGEAQIETKKDKDAPLRGQGETILVVEDDTSILKMIRLLLESLDYRVLAAESPNAALRLVKEHNSEIHLLITDVIMPEMNGKILSNQLQELCPSLKCLYMSGYTA